MRTVEGGNMLGKFVAAKYEIDLVCRGPLFLPPFKGSSLRGALTMQFKKLVCHQPTVKTCQGCEKELSCSYAYVFETPVMPGQKGTVGYSKFPRPFVVEPPLDERQEYSEGELLKMSLILFGKAIDYLPYFVVTLRELGASGVGTGRAPFELGAITAVDPFGERREVVYDPADPVVRQTTVFLTYSDAIQAAAKLPNDRVLVDFLTCTRLMYQGRPVYKPDFHALLRNLLRRISLLSAGHCDEWPDLDYTGLHSRAQKVRIVRSNLEMVYWEHVSSRQGGKRIPHEGIVGMVEYEGDVEEFLPFLVLGMLTHVGDSPVFGMGQYTILRRFF